MDHYFLLAKGTESIFPKQAITKFFQPLKVMQTKFIFIIISTAAWDVLSVQTIFCSSFRIQSQFFYLLRFNFLTRSIQG